jgi:cobalt-zinc-cadmium efflux system outer membrane protein
MQPWFIYILFLLPASVAFAADLQTRDKLTLDQAIVYVLERNPSLRAADYEARAAAARIRTARLTPAFQTSIEFENFAGNGIYDGIDAMESTLSLSKVLELGDKARLRGDVAHNEAMLLRNQQDAERLDLLAETTRRYLQVIIDQERLIIAQESLTLAQHTHDVVGIRVKAGKSPDAELRRLEIALAKQELKLDHARHMLETSRLKLAIMWGETQTYFNMADADLYQIEQAAPFESLVQLLDRNPDLALFATEQRLAETRIQLARSRRKADIEVAGGVRHLNFTDNTALVMSLNIPFGNTTRAAPRIEEAELGSQRNPYNLEQRRLELHATLHEAHQELIHAIDAVEVLKNTIIPLAKSQLRDYEKGYNAGRYSLLELNIAQRTLLDSRLEYVMAAADYHRYRIEIDRLTGAGLSTGVNP